MNAASDCPLVLSLGAVREGCAAIEAFGDLLASRRVGPRALTHAKAATIEACVTLVAALRPFERTLQTALGGDSEAKAILRPLFERLESHLSTITTALQDWSPLSARHRLGLETSFRTYRADIKDCVALCDLAVAAAAVIPVDLDLVGLMEQRQDDRVPEGRTVTLGIDVDATTIRTDRRVLAGLIELAVAFACRDGGDAALLTARARPDGTFVIRVGRAPSNRSPQRAVTVLRRGELDLGLEVARMAARRAGLDMSFDGATNAVSIALGRMG